jgi:hypothetical protein
MLASRNAFQHGLASKPGQLARRKVMKLAQLFSGASNKKRPTVDAITAAEAQFRLSSVRKVQKDLLNPLWKKLSTRGGVPPETLSKIVNALVKLERYERRAFSLHLRALRSLAEK